MIMKKGFLLTLLIVCCSIWFVGCNETKKVVADYEVILRNEKEELQVLEQQEAERKGKKEG